MQACTCAADNPQAVRVRRTEPIASPGLHVQAFALRLYGTALLPFIHSLHTPPRPLPYLLVWEGALGNEKPSVDLHQHAVAHAPAVLQVRHQPSPVVSTLLSVFGVPHRLAARARMSPARVMQRAMPCPLWPQSTMTGTASHGAMWTVDVHVYLQGQAWRTTPVGSATV